MKRLRVSSTVGRVCSESIKCNRNCLAGYIISRYISDKSISILTNPEETNRVHQFLFTKVVQNWDFFACSCAMQLFHTLAITILIRRRSRFRSIPRSKIVSGSNTRLMKVIGPVLVTHRCPEPTSFIVQQKMSK